MLVEFEFFSTNELGSTTVSVRTDYIPRIEEEYEYEDENGKSYFGKVINVQTYHKKYKEGGEEEKIHVLVSLFDQK